LNIDYQVKFPRFFALNTLVSAKRSTATGQNALRYSVEVLAQIHDHEIRRCWGRQPCQTTRPLHGIKKAH